MEKLVKEPIYQQLNRILKKLIERGEYQVGDQFLTERAICERYGVSRVTANKALSNLVSEGLLEFSKGVGTFVRRRSLDYELQALVSFTSKAKAAGKTPRTKVLEFKKRSVDECESTVGEKLNLEGNEELYRVDRLRFADAIPVILEHRYIVARYCPNLQKRELSRSLYDLWIQKYNLNITGSDEVIRVVNADNGKAKQLQIKPNDACMLISAVGYIDENLPLWYEKTLYRGDVFELHNHLGPVREPRAGIEKFIL